MALNFVTVTGTFYDASPSGSSAASGSILFVASDLIWDVTGTFVGVINNVGTTFNASGQISVELLAMDNAGLSGNWGWLCTVTMSGVTYPQRKLVVNYANGATQDISALLANSTLV